MSRLEDLIQTLCPDGVGYQKLGDICQIATGKLNVNKQSDNGKYPFFTCAKEVYRIDIFAFDTEALLISGNGNVGYIHYYNGKFNAYQRTYVLSNFSINIFFVKHVLEWGLKKRIAEGLRLGSVPYIRLETLRDFFIPLPPLPVQEEIVRILDTFSDVVAELEAEQADRIRQYEHYRKELLSLEVTDVTRSKKIGLAKKGSNNISTGNELVRIDELCHIQRGRVMSKDYLRDNEGNYPVFSSQTENEGIFGYINSFDFDFESLTWTTDGANAGSIFYHNQEKFSITNVCGLLKVKSPRIITKFLYYVLKERAKEYVNDGMGNPKLMSNVMGRIKIFVPPLNSQEQIVSILDRFDTLVNDLKSGLPAEIALRRKQYEYYRDKLLTFPAKQPPL